MAPPWSLSGAGKGKRGTCQGRQALVSGGYPGRPCTLDLITNPHHASNPSPHSPSSPPLSISLSLPKQPHNPAAPAHSRSLSVPQTEIPGPSVMPPVRGAGQTSDHPTGSLLCSQPEGGCVESGERGRAEPWPRQRRVQTRWASGPAYLDVPGK